MMYVAPGSAAAHDLFLEAYGERLYEMFAWLKTELAPHGMMDVPDSKAASMPMYHAFVDAIMKSIITKPTYVPRVDSWGGGISRS